MLFKIMDEVVVVEEGGPTSCGNANQGEIQ